MTTNKNTAFITYIKKHIELSLILRESYCEHDVLALEHGNGALTYFSINANVLTGYYELRIYNCLQSDSKPHLKKFEFIDLKLALETIMIIIKSVDTKSTYINQWLQEFKMKTTLTVFQLVTTVDSEQKELNFSSQKKAEDAQQVVSALGLESEIFKTKKVVEL